MLRGATQLQLGAVAPSHRPVRRRALDGRQAAEALPDQRPFRIAPGGMTPCSTNRQSAIANLVVTATIPTDLPRLIGPGATLVIHDLSALARGWGRR